MPQKAAGCFNDAAYKPTTTGLSMPAGHGKGNEKTILMAASHGKFSDSDADDSDDEFMRPLAKLCPSIKKI